MIQTRSRSPFKRLALAGLLAFAPLAVLAQFGCGGNSHQPPVADEATLEQEAKEQLEIRAQEMSGSKP
ncbi:MAG TPA: hypothetical protein VGN57_09535 [Pirellulaceae bacterium]|jgi:hypothetical protein|nr:hypothetical protein [Pirellulaceae bacterium]